MILWMSCDRGNQFYQSLGFRLGFNAAREELIRRGVPVGEVFYAAVAKRKVVKAGFCCAITYGKNGPIGGSPC